MLHKRTIHSLFWSGVAAATFSLGGAPALAQGAGDLLVAPTRLELVGFRGTQVILNNIGAETATYRISLEFRRMKPDGDLVEIDAANASATEKIAEQMIVYAPRRVTLEPNQPQSIRVGVRPPPGLPDGEYRAHMLFRAIPKPTPAGQSKPTDGGIAIELKPIYGITIPVFVRAGNLAAEAGISNARLTTEQGKQLVTFDLTRTGNRSVFGDVRVFKPGQSDPLIVAKGMAVYPEIDRRTVRLAAPAGFVGTLAGPAKIQFVERNDEGTGKVLAEADVVLR